MNINKPTIMYYQEPCGLCPRQAEGTINNHDFYFRARGSHWSLEVAYSPNITLDLSNTSNWRYVEEYKGVNYKIDGDNQFCAGYATIEESKEFIERIAKHFIEYLEFRGDLKITHISLNNNNLSIFVNSLIEWSNWLNNRGSHPDGRVLSSYIHKYPYLWKYYIYR